MLFFKLKCHVYQLLPTIGEIVKNKMFIGFITRYCIPFIFHNYSQCLSQRAQFYV